MKLNNYFARRETALTDETLTLVAIEQTNKCELQNAEETMNCLFNELVL